jgi:IS30 family transposase
LSSARAVPACLADNGSEFSNPKRLEFDADGERRTWVFCCDPHASFQKPNVELNHEFIRRVSPKGTSFDALAQEDVNLMMSHVNSYSGGKLNDKSPFDMFGFLYGRDVLECSGFAGSRQMKSCSSSRCSRNKTGRS